MDTPGTDPNDTRSTVPDPARERVVTAPAYPSPSVYVSESNEDVTLPIKNRVQWGPIIAGLISALAIFLLLTVLGIALGASVLDPANAGEEIGTWAAIWSALSAIVAFFVGGWVAAKTSAVGGTFGGLMNGLMVGAAGLVLIIYLTATGLGALFGTLSSSAGDIISAAGEVAPQSVETTVPEEPVDQATEEVEQTVESIEPESAFEAVRNSAFGTFLGMLLPILAAGLGGWLGHNTRYEILTGGG